MLTMKFATECRVCGVSIAAGESAHVRKAGGGWDACCAHCCAQLADEREINQLLDCLLIYNGGDLEELDPGDHRLLADVFPAFAKYHRDPAADSDDLPAFLGGKYGQLPVWASDAAKAQLARRQEYDQKVADWRSGLDPSSRAKLDGATLMLERSTGKQRHALRQALRDLEKELGRPGYERP